MNVFLWMIGVLLHLTGTDKEYAEFCKKKQSQSITDEALGDSLTVKSYTSPTGL